MGVLNEEFDGIKFNGWLIRNILALYAQKCEFKFFLMGFNRRLNSISASNVKIKDNVINRVTHFKYLYMYRCTKSDKCLD